MSKEPLGQVRSSFVDSAVEPLTWLKGVCFGVPFNKLNPFRWPTSKYHCGRRLSSKQNEKAGRHRPFLSFSRDLHVLHLLFSSISKQLLKTGVGCWRKCFKKSLLGLSFSTATGDFAQNRLVNVKWQLLHASWLGTSELPKNLRNRRAPSA